MFYKKVGELMKKHGDELFQIGEVVKILGVTRKALLVYEDMGLLTPAVKNLEFGRLMMPFLK